MHAGTGREGAVIFPFACGLSGMSLQWCDSVCPVTSYRLLMNVVENHFWEKKDGLLHWNPQVAIKAGRGQWVSVSWRLRMCLSLPGFDSLGALISK